MSKIFSNITEMEGYKKERSDEFYITLRSNIPECIGNTLLRTMISSIHTYTIDPKSIVFHNNTSPWDNQLLENQFVYIPFMYNIFDKKDINMIEIELQATNKDMKYRYVKTSEIIVKNKEKDTILNNDDIFFRNIPLFLLGYNEEVHMTCSLEYNTQKNTNSRHQASNCGMYFDENTNEVRLLITKQTGIESKDIIIYSIESIITRLQELQQNIITSNKEKVYVQINANMRFDFILIDDDYTIGSLIETWNNHYLENTVTGCKKSIDHKSIILDFGVKGLDTKEKEGDVIKIFIESLKNIEKYMNTLLEDAKKISVKTISIPKYMENIQEFRKMVM